MGIGLLGIGLAFGLAVLVGAFAFGHVSGGHFTFIYDLTVRRQIMGLAKPKERHWRLEELKRDVDLLEILVFFLAVAFLVYFAKWLAALHRRRRKGLDQGPSFRTLNRPQPDDSRSRDTR